MARWKLLSGHYLNVPGTKWEYSEINRTNGRPNRVEFDVPMLLDPTDPTMWTHKSSPDEGEIVVCQGNGDPRDIVFVGDPTPDMEPLDDEAREISAKFTKKWAAFGGGSSTVSFGENIVDQLQLELARKQSEPAPIPGMTELLSAMAKLIELQTPAAAATVARRT